MGDVDFQAHIDTDTPGKVRYQVTHAQDVAPYLRKAELQRQAEEAFTTRRNEVRPNASIPLVVAMEIRQKYGIDVWNITDENEERFWQIMQTEYPKFLTTNQKVYRRT